jgi:hypothetical protein
MEYNDGVASMLPARLLFNGDRVRVGSRAIEAKASCSWATAFVVKGRARVRCKQCRWCGHRAWREHGTWLEGMRVGC